MWWSKTESIAVDMEEIIKFALGEAGANEVYAIETKVSHLEKKFKFNFDDTSSDGAKALEVTEEDYEDFFCRNFLETNLVVRWENGADVSFMILNNNELYYSVCVHYPDRTDLKKYDAAKWREAIMFAANEWWKDG